MADACASGLSAAGRAGVEQARIENEEIVPSACARLESPVCLQHVQQALMDEDADMARLILLRAD
jgi:hypothetical protein